MEEEQVVMSHSPLKMFRQFHDKHVLINGQGPVKEIAQNLGFTKVTSVEELSACFPYLDVMDHKRRRTAVSCWIFLKPNLSFSCAKQCSDWAQFIMVCVCVFIIFCVC